MKTMDLRGAQLSRRRLLGATGSAMVLAAAGAPRAQADPGRLVVYSTTLPSIQKQVAEVFTKKTGIAVQSLRLVNNPLAQRFVAEQKARQYACDVITLGLDVFFNDISKAGYLADIEDIPGVSALKPEWHPGKQYVNLLYGPSAIGYNTSLVTGAMIPKDWPDLLNPAFKGQILIPDPRSNDTNVAFFDMLQHAYGDDFLRQLGEQQLKPVPAMPQGAEQVIAGEAKILLPCMAMVLLQYEGTGAPIAMSPTPSVTQGQSFYTGISAHAPNMAGARKWLEFVISQEGQEILCRDNAVSALGHIPGSLAPAAHLVPTDTVAAMSNADHLFDLLRVGA